MYPSLNGQISLTGRLQVQKKVPADDLEPQGHISLFLIHSGKKDELGLGDEAGA